MSLSFFLLIFLGLGWAPVWSLNLFRQAEVWQQTQIALDNCGIRLGRRDRDLFQGLAMAEKKMKWLHEKHHPLHVCAAVPKTRLVCAPKDKELESEILTVWINATALAQANWKTNTTLIESEIGALPGSELKRELSLPVKTHYCPICHLPLRWAVAEAEKLKTTIQAVATRPLMTVVSLRSPNERQIYRKIENHDLKHWEYRLEAFP